MATTKAARGSTPPEPPLDPDPEIAALLDFEPVVRRNRRHDGWQPEHQRGFIAALARLGNVDRAAHSVGRTASGAWTVRSSAGAEGFAESWDCALDLFHARNPGISRRGGRARPPWVPEEPAPPPARGRAAGPPLTPEEEERERLDLFAALIKLYWAKAKAERRCRLAGRIVAADFYVRQMTCIELAADLSEHGQQFLAELQRGDVRLLDAVATPLSFCFDYLRRCVWADSGEPDRPELPFFFSVADGVAAAPPAHYEAAEAGMPYGEWCGRGDLDAATAAEAQRLWEEKARTDAAIWRARLEREEPEKLPAILGEPELKLAPEELAEWERAAEGGEPAGKEPAP